MTINEQIAVMKAFAEGKSIQYKLTEEWKDAINPTWNWDDYKYRIKPDVVLLPKKGDLIWVSDGDGECVLVKIYSVENEYLRIYNTVNSYFNPIHVWDYPMSDFWHFAN